MGGMLRNSFPRFFYKCQGESLLSAQRQPGGVHLLEYVLRWEENVHMG